jgi:hypothetical protein
MRRDIVNDGIIERSDIDIFINKTFYEPMMAYFADHFPKFTVAHLDLHPGSSCFPFVWLGLGRLNAGLDFIGNTNRTFHGVPS